MSPVRARGLSALLLGLLPAAALALTPTQQVMVNGSLKPGAATATALPLEGDVSCVIRDVSLPIQSQVQPTQCTDTSVGLFVKVPQSTSWALVHADAGSPTRGFNVPWSAWANVLRTSSSSTLASLVKDGTITVGTGYVDGCRASEPTKCVASNGKAPMKWADAAYVLLTEDVAVYESNGAPASCTTGLISIAPCGWIETVQTLASCEAVDAAVASKDVCEGLHARVDAVQLQWSIQAARAEVARLEKDDSASLSEDWYTLAQSQQVPQRDRDALVSGAAKALSAHFESALSSKETFWAQHHLGALIRLQGEEANASRQRRLSAMLDATASSGSGSSSGGSPSEACFQATATCVSLVSSLSANCTVATSLMKECMADKGQSSSSCMQHANKANFFCYK